MDNKNVFVAIALSMSVLLFWGAFFETPRKPTAQKNDQNIEKSNNDILSTSDKAFVLNFDQKKDITEFNVEIKKDGKYAFFTEHMPFEFEADEHFFKDLAKNDIEPVAQEPDMGGHSEHDAEGFEWAGTFDLKEGSYKWSFAKVDGEYADPAMKMVIL